MQLVENAVVSFVRRSRPDPVADRPILEVAFPAGPIRQLQVLGLDLGDDPPVCEDRVGSGWQRVVRRVRLTLLTGADDVQVELVDAAARPKRQTDVDRHRHPGDDQRPHHVQLHRSSPSARQRLTVL